MGKVDKLLERARLAPNQVRFADAVRLAEAHGFVHVRTRGSHTMFKHARQRMLLNLQNDAGHVPAYQVRQLLATIAAVSGAEG
ncbi:MAG: type II toxin-antitoxin system HicA family toxin [Trueperaceae bacterium]|nr:type II toxin-antitoxin system HicA family toxin [Trueperaceae bacterium]